MRLQMLAQDIKKERYLDFLQSIENDAQFLERGVTGDESWISEYDLETKCRSMEWHTLTSPQPKRARMGESKIQRMMIYFFDSIHSHTVCAWRPDCESAILPRGSWKTSKKSDVCETKHQEQLGVHHDQAPTHTVIGTLIVKTTIVNFYLFWDFHWNRYTETYRSTLFTRRPRLFWKLSGSFKKNLSCQLKRICASVPIPMEISK